MPLRSILRRHTNCNVVLAEVTDVDVARKHLVLADGELAIVNVDMPEVDHGSILASPWFWTVVGVVVIGAGVATYLYMNDKAQLVPGGDYQVSFPN